jgi:hypothetical protein
MIGPVLNVANRPVPHAHSAARNMISSPAKGLKWGGECGNFTQMNAVKVDSAKRIRLTVLTPGDYYEPEVRGGDAEEITLRRMPPPRRRFTKLEALRAIEKSPLRFTHSWDQVKEETRG